MWTVIFYKRDNGEIPVKNFLNSLSEKQKVKSYWEIKLLQQYGIHLKEPYAKPISGDEYKGLWELRIKFASNISRIFYFMPFGKTFILLHGFVKKTQKTPGQELVKAKKYMDECVRRLKKNEQENRGPF
ncbi:MAG: type II toxin-antitoxin system RelE/ParE family toxin [Candidatus Eremiobacterota bacterium]